MYRSTQVLHLSRGGKHTHGHRHALSTCSDGMAASDVKNPKDTVITHFLDWSVVSLAPETLNMTVQPSISPANNSKPSVSLLQVFTG